MGTTMKRIMIDASKCDGCKNCSIACMNSHREDGDNIYTLVLTDKANETRNFIKNDKKGGYNPIFCRHCSMPGCANSCMSGALSKNPVTGHVEYDQEKCAACFMCVMNCPYGLPKPDTLTNTKIIKCDFCSDKPEGPSCVAACPKDAIYVKEV